MKRALLILAALAGTAPAPIGARRAHADVWRDALKADATRDLYDEKLRMGDEHVAQANIKGTSLAEVRRQLGLALRFYKEAATARPNAAEPWFRVADTLYSFYIASCEDNQYGRTRSPLKDCSQGDAIDKAIAQQVIDAWAEAEKRAPLDPRFSGNDGDSILFDRAILNTKLGIPKTLEAATKDYEAYLDRSDGKGPNIETTRSNLAETYMMLGRLDDSIDVYREIGTPSSVSTIYGAAVALDRAERTPLALDLIRGQGPTGYQSFRRSVEFGFTFFVPPGEQFYYFALAEEAFGNIDASIGYWRDYLRSEAGTRKTGAHPQFQARAKHHLDALVKKRGKTAPPPNPFLDL